MSRVKINNKNYDVPELKFKHMKMFENAGVPITNMIGSESAMNVISAFVQIVVDCDEDTADNLIEQHIFGGGDIKDIYGAYVDAVTESAFFKKLLGMEENKNQEKKAENKQK